MMIRSSDAYKEFFNAAYMMGPNSIRLLDELLCKVRIPPNARVLDLGCGTGLTSLFLAKETSAQVFATDLWISATDNYHRFLQWDISETVIPVHADANDLPFSDEYFYYIVSVDVLHYFSNQSKFFQRKILPLLKPGGTALFTMPGLKVDFDGNEPPDVKEWASGENNEYPYYHSCQWWRRNLGENADMASIEIWEMENFDIAWQEWLQSGHPYSVRDRAFFQTGIDQHLNFVGAIVKKK